MCGYIKIGGENAVTIASSSGQHFTHKHKSTVTAVSQRPALQARVLLYRCCCTAAVPLPYLRTVLLRGCFL